MLRLLRNRLETWLRTKERMVVRWPLVRYLNSFQVDCVLDVGANVGQYASEIRAYGYHGRIESFEPMRDAFTSLKRASSNDKLWRVHQFALGDEDGGKNIHVSAHSPSSSFLEMKSTAQSAPVDLSYVQEETVVIKRLDTVLDSVLDGAQRPFLKIDTQGYERPVLCGAGGLLGRMVGIQLEVSLVMQYEGEALIEDQIEYLRERGYAVWWIIPGYRDHQTCQMLQADLILFRNDIAPRHIANGL